MDNKYYTPTIEEFHEGFEYQEEIPSLHINLNTGEQAPSDLVWRDFKFSRTSHFIYNTKEDEFTCSLEQDIKDGTVRVKYLDKADIESLGFTSKELAYQEACYPIEYQASKTLENGETVGITYQSQFEEDLFDIIPVDTAYKVEIFYDRSTAKDFRKNWVDEPREKQSWFKGYIKNKSELKDILKKVGV